MNYELFELYLRNRYKKETVRSYLWSCEHFLDAVGIENLSALRYKDIMDYIGTLREKNHKPNHIATQLGAVKALFNYMVKSGDRIDNPAYGILLKDSFRKPLQFQDLFTPEELKLLLVRKENAPQLKYRNQALLGLLIYQALTSRDIRGLRISDVDLEQKEVFIGAKTNTLSRILKLEPSQLHPLENYIRYERPLLEKKAEKESNLLILSNLGGPIEKTSLHHQIKLSQNLFPGRPLNCITIRQSIIVNKFLAGWNIREVQLFAGIKYASTVERYKPVDRRALQDSLMRFHPMG